MGLQPSETSWCLSELARAWQSSTEHSYCGILRARTTRHTYVKGQARCLHRPYLPILLARTKANVLPLKTFLTFLSGTNSNSQISEECGSKHCGTRPGLGSRKTGWHERAG